MPTNRPSQLLYLDDHRGIYIPRDFVAGTKRECIANVEQSDLDACAAGPDHEWYWEAWDSITSNARVTDPDTKVTYTLYQDGALWLIPDGMEWDDREGWRWPDEDDSEEAP